MNATPVDHVIRRATLDDAPALSRLLDQLGFPADAITVARRLDALTRAGETVLVASRGDEAIGFVAVHITPVLHRPTSVGRITALVVAENVRGGGVGSALVEAAERHAATAGCALMEVTSNQKLAGAHDFYRRLGYSVTSYRFGKTIVPASAAPTI